MSYDAIGVRKVYINLCIKYLCIFTFGLIWITNWVNHFWLFWKDKNDEDFSGPRGRNEEKHIQNLALERAGINYYNSSIAGQVGSSLCTCKSVEKRTKDETHVHTNSSHPAGRGGVRQRAWVHDMFVNGPSKSRPNPCRPTTSFCRLFLLRV
jgi:hypothetical protein